MKKVTLSDIARLSGYSVTSVSVALTGSDRVKLSEQAKSVIIQTAEKLGYSRAATEPSPHRKIAIVIDQICPDDPFTNCITAIRNTCWAGRMIPVILDYNRNLEFAKITAGFIHEENYAGVILASQRGCVLPDGLVRPFTPPVVMVNCTVNNYHSDSVISDDATGAYLAAEHLIKQGYERIAHISGDISHQVSSDRLRGFVSALNHHDIMINEQWIVSGGWTIEGGYTATVKILETRPRVQAIFCSNDMSAVGAYLALKEHGIKIPHDIAVIGYDDIMMCSQVSPRLSTIATPYAYMGQLAVSRLLNIIQGIEDQKGVVSVRPELVIRNSTVKTG